MFGGFVFVVVFCHAFQLPVLGVWFVFVMPVFWCLFVGFQIVLNWIRLPCGGGFCLESLILAQDERWRRA